MGAFFSSLIGSYSNSMLAKEKLQRDQEQQERRDRLAVLTAAAASPNFNWSDPKVVDALTSQIDDVTGGGKGKKGGGSQSLGNILKTLGQRVSGRVPAPQSLSKPLNLQGMMMSPEQMGQQQGAQQAATAKAKLLALEKDLKDSGAWDSLTPREKAEIEAGAYGERLPVEKPKVELKPVRDPKSSTGYSWGRYEDGKLIGMEGEAAAPGSAGGSSNEPVMYKAKDGKWHWGYRDPRSQVISDAVTKQPVQPTDIKPIQALPTVTAGTTTTVTAGPHGEPIATETPSTRISEKQEPGAPPPRAPGTPRPSRQKPYAGDLDKLRQETTTKLAAFDQQHQAGKMDDQTYVNRSIDVWKNYAQTVRGYGQVPTATQDLAVLYVKKYGSATEARRHMAEDGWRIP